MTFEEAAKKKLELLGMQDIHIEKVLETAKSNPVLSGFKDRWGHDMSGYPSTMFNIVWMGVRSTALTWIDANIPQAFYRQSFLQMISFAFNSGNACWAWDNWILFIR